MDIDKIIKVKHSDKPIPRTERTSQFVPDFEIEEPDQLAPMGELESLAEPTRSESIYGSGWSLAELMNEFGGR